MSMTSTANDIIEEAIRILSEPIGLEGWTPPEVETAEQLQAAEDEERDARLRARIDAYTAQRNDGLAFLRHVREAAMRRAEQYTEEAHRWSIKARNQAGIASYAADLAMIILVNERVQAGMGEGDAYRVEFPNGLKIGLRITRPVVVSDMEMLPAKLVRTKTTREPDKVAIGKLLKAGEAVSGARLGVSEHVDWGR